MIYSIINRLRIWWLFQQCDQRFLYWAFGPDYKSLSTQEKMQRWNVYHKDLFRAHILVSDVKEVRHQISQMGDAWSNYLLIEKDFISKYD